MDRYVNSIINSDCLEGLKNTPEDSVDLTVTSPPYDDLRKYKGYSFDFEGIAQELYRVTKPGGVVVWVVGDSTNNGSESGTSFRQALKFMEIGFKLHDTMIYEKNTSSFPARRTSKRYTQIFEYMFVFTKGKIKTGNLICDKENKWFGQKNWGRNTHRNKDGELVETEDIKPVPKYSPRNNIWRYVVGGGYGQKDKSAYKHPATFPTDLAKDHILTWTNKGDIVLDPFMGSGTTAIACIELGRNYVGFEISEEYCDLINTRIENFSYELKKEKIIND